MEVIGTFLKASEIKTFESGYQVQEFYLDYSKFDQYTGEKRENILRFQLNGDNIGYLENINKGEKVKVYFVINGKFYDKKDGTGKAHFQNLNAYKVEKLEQKQPATPTPQPTQSTNFEEEEEDDLPF